MSKFSKIPGGKDDKAPLRLADDFIAATDNLPATETYPWLSQDDIKRRGSSVNVRFTGAELLKLKFISEQLLFRCTSSVSAYSGMRLKPRLPN
jgi:hypothetical protein